MVSALGGSAKHPCFYVSGNHEFRSGKADDFKDILSSCGVKVLEGTSEVLTVRGVKICVSGIDAPEVDRYASRAMPYAKQKQQLGATVDNELFTTLLSHRPEQIEEFLPLQPDLVLSGHAHDGQWRIPFYTRERFAVTESRVVSQIYERRIHFR